MSEPKVMRFSLLSGGLEPDPRGVWVREDDYARLAVEFEQTWTSLRLALNGAQHQLDRALKAEPELEQTRANEADLALMLRRVLASNEPDRLRLKAVELLNRLELGGSPLRADKDTK